MKRSTYSPRLLSVTSTFSGVLFISTPACTGPLAWAFRSSARPSQNCATLNTALNTVGALRGPFCQPWPIEVSRLSSPPMPRLWQVLQLIRWLAERRGSKNSILPSSTFSRVTALPFTAGTHRGDRLEGLLCLLHQLLGHTGRRHRQDASQQGCKEWSKHVSCLHRLSVRHIPVEKLACLGAGAFDPGHAAADASRATVPQLQLDGSGPFPVFPASALAGAGSGGKRSGHTPCAACTLSSSCPAPVPGIQDHRRCHSCP